MNLQQKSAYFACKAHYYEWPTTFDVLIVIAFHKILLLSTNSVLFTNRQIDWLAAVLEFHILGTSVRIVAHDHSSVTFFFAWKLWYLSRSFVQKLCSETVFSNSVQKFCSVKVICLVTHVTEICWNGHCGLWCIHLLDCNTYFSITSLACASF